MALLVVLDLVGTFVFAISGATAAVARRLDLFGTLVLSFVAGNVGGITRDVLIGSVPPAASSDLRYLAVSIFAGMITFYWSSAVEKLSSPVLVFDAAGLALFAVSGAQKALAFGLNPVMAALLGMSTGVGGGMARDLLVAEIPTVLQSEIYAVAALAGAAVGGDRNDTGNSVGRHSDVWRGPLLWPASYGYSSWLAPADRKTTWRVVYQKIQPARLDDVN